MRKLLIVGDSLAGGLPHISFPVVLAKMVSGYEFTVSSVAGDTLAGIGGRIRDLVPRHNPDVLVIEGGGNDIGLPILKSRGGNWKKLAERFEKRGGKAADDAHSFESNYSEILESIHDYRLNIVVTTIGCIGEDPENGLNSLREEFNEVIRGVAQRFGAEVADVGRVFERVLAKVDRPSRYLMGNLNNAFSDTFHMLTPNRAYRLSARRGLVLTVDGAHNNPYGAMIYAESIREALPQ